MFGTYELMSRLVTTDLLNLNEDKLAEMYKKADTRLQDRIIATLVVKMFPMVMKIQRKFFSLSLEEKSEMMMHCIMRGLDKHDPKKAKTKFTTFFYGNYSNGLISKMAYYNTEKRKAWTERVTSDFKINTQSYSMDDDIFTFIKEIDNSPILDSIEKEVCKNIAMGYKTNKAISQRVTNSLNRKVTPLLVNKTKKKLQTKIKENSYSIF